MTKHDRPKRQDWSKAHLYRTSHCEESHKVMTGPPGAGHLWTAASTSQETPAHGQAAPPLGKTARRKSHRESRLTVPKTPDRWPQHHRDRHNGWRDLPETTDLLWNAVVVHILELQAWPRSSELPTQYIRMPHPPSRYPSRSANAPPASLASAAWKRCCWCCELPSGLLLAVTTVLPKAHCTAAGPLTVSQGREEANGTQLSEATSGESDVRC